MLATLITLLEKAALLLPRPLALFIGKSLGWSAFYLFPRRRRIALDNIQQALGKQYSHIEQRQIIKQSFQHLGMTLIEFLRLQEITADNLSQFVTFHGLAYLEEAYAKKQGILVLTAHLGNWELLAAAVSLRGFNTSVVVKTARQIAVNDFLIKQRTSKGLRLFAGKNLLKPVLKQLQEGRIVGIVLDQSAVKSEGVTVSFFGRPASTMKSLAVLAMRTQATVLPIYSYREHNNHQHIIIHPPITETGADNTGAMTDMVAARTALYTQSIEQAIRAHPAQWIWTHRRWKTPD